MHKSIWKHEKKACRNIRTYKVRDACVTRHLCFIQDANKYVTTIHLSARVEVSVEIVLRNFC